MWTTGFRGVRWQEKTQRREPSVSLPVLACPGPHEVPARHCGCTSPRGLHMGGQVDLLNPAGF